jgi:hypothetical protein
MADPGTTSAAAERAADAAEQAEAEAVTAYESGPQGQLAAALLAADEPDPDDNSGPVNASNAEAAAANAEAQMQATMMARTTKIAAAINTFVEAKIQEALSDET